MKTIENVKQFLEEFAEKEYQVNVGQLDSSISDKEHDDFVLQFFNKFYSSFYGALDIGGMTVRSFEGLDEEEIQDEIKSLQTRKIFLIKQYKNTRFGKGVLSDGKDMFSCFLSMTINPRNFNRYQADFIVTTYQGELKIVSKRTLDHEYKGDKLNWGYDKRSVEKADGMTVLNNGELVDILRLREPDHEFWVRDYNEE